MQRSTFHIGLVLVSLISAPISSQAGPNPLGCRALIDGDFRKTSLANPAKDSLAEPTHLDFDRTPDGLDIYFTERYGKVRCYHSRTGKVSTLGALEVLTKGELGLIGIALDPGFRTNRFLYLYYSTGKDKDPYTHRISRFTLAGDVLDPNSEKILFRAPTKTEYYPGGAMKFDAKGDLYITIGEGSMVQYFDGVHISNVSSLDTHSPLGKILRIHPLAAGGYSIPEGNLFPHGDTSRTLPEIFAMGVNNPFSISFDTKTGKAAWGDFGLDDGSAITDEYNLSGTAGNYGWPFFSGPNTVLKTGQDPAHPRQDDSVKGLKELPPALAATVSVRQNCPIAGPVYHYDAYPASSNKLPMQFDGLWFVTDFNTGYVDTMSVSASGTVGARGHVFPSLKLNNPTDLQIGPDGSLYAVDYGAWFSTTSKTSLSRIDYTGNCYIPDTGIRPAGTEAGPFSMSGSTLRVTYPGRYRLSVADMGGKVILDQEVRDGHEFDLGFLSRNRLGVYVVSLRSGMEIRSGKIAMVRGGND